MDLNEYIEQCKNKKTQMDDNFNSYMKTLKEISSDPKLIFTKLYENLKHPMPTVLEYKTAITREVLVPIIKSSFQVFDNFQIENSSFWALVCKHNKFGSFYINIDTKSYKIWNREPNFEYYTMPISEFDSNAYKIFQSLKAYCDNKNIPNFIAFLKQHYNNTKKMRLFKTLRCIKFVHYNERRMNSANKFIDRYESKIRENENGRQKYLSDMKLIEESQDDFDNLEKFLCELGYVKSDY